jgi:hypothetical protein
MHRIPLAAFAAACLFAVACDRNRPAPTESPVFSAANGSNALARVARFVAIRPRDAGTAGAAYAAQWIAQELRAAGLKPVADTWREATVIGPTTFSNIHAEIPGQTNQLIVIGSHFDTKSGILPDFEGANDGGSSTGLLLELAHVLRRGPPLRHAIRFAFFDGEEAVESYRPNDGLHGSRRMAGKLAQSLANRQVTAVIILDMVGDAALNLEVPRNVTPWLAKIALEAGVDAGYPKLAIARGAILDDHWPFFEHGMPAVNLIDFDYGSVPGKHDYWHTSEDTVDKLSAESLAITGRIVLEMVRRIDAGIGVPEPYFVAAPVPKP